MVADGDGGAAIAAAMGRTRNSILGRAHRLGIQLGAGKHIRSAQAEAKKVPRGATKPRPAPRPAPSGKWTDKGSKLEQIVQAREISEALKQGWPKPRNPHSVNLFGLRAGMCRFPLWSDEERDIDAKFYCGAPAEEGRSYCTRCYALSVGGGAPGERSAIAAASRIAGVRL